MEDAYRLAPHFYPNQVYGMIKRGLLKGQVEELPGDAYRLTPIGRDQWTASEKTAAAVSVPPPPRRSAPVPGRLAIVRGLPGSGVSTTGAALAKATGRAFIEMSHFLVRDGRRRTAPGALEDFLAAVQFFGQRGVDLVVGLDTVEGEALRKVIELYYTGQKRERPAQVITLNRSLAECAATNRRGLTLPELEALAAEWTDYPGETMEITGTPYFPALGN